MFLIWVSQRAAVVQRAPAVWWTTKAFGGCVGKADVLAARALKNGIIYVRICTKFVSFRNIYPHAARERIFAQGPVWALATAKRARTAMKHFMFLVQWSKQELKFQTSNQILIYVEIRTDYRFLWYLVQKKLRSCDNSLTLFLSHLLSFIYSV